MSKIIFIVRHGQSEANAGGVAKFRFPEIPLTEKGQQQSQNFADNFQLKPDIIFSSNFLRARQTAQPLREKFPEVPFEVEQDCREFSYLNPEACKGTTFQQRKQQVNEYWARMDPSYCDGEDVETFSGFITRTKSFIQKMKNRRENCIVVFSHFLFMKLLQLIQECPHDSDIELMKKYPEFKEHKDIDNCEMVEFTIC